MNELLFSVIVGVAWTVLTFLFLWIIGGDEKMRKKGTLNNGLYFWLKWATIIVLPALTTLVTQISKAVGYAETGAVVAEIIAAVATFLGTILCISNYNYYKKEDKE